MRTIVIIQKNSNFTDDMKYQEYTNINNNKNNKNNMKI